MHADDGHGAARLTETSQGAPEETTFETDSNH